MGKRTRGREKIGPYPPGVGEECTGPDSTTEFCTDQKYCPVDCVWDQWGSWQKCSKTCGAGTTIRTRDVKVQAQHGGKPCEGPAKESKECESLPPCPKPIDCEWDQWGSWQKCSKTCGTGLTIRTRDVKVQEQHGGKPCEGPAKESKECDFLCFTESVRKGFVAGTIDHYGPNYMISFDFKIMRTLPHDWHNLFHATATGRDCDNTSGCQEGKFTKGDRIPGVWFIGHESSGLWMLVALTNRGNQEDYLDKNIQINQLYKVQLQQKGKKNSP